MTTILYCYALSDDEWYLTSWDEDGPDSESNPINGEVYFRSGYDVLFRDPPTFFRTIEEAISAAEEMGFTVLQTA